MEQEQVQFLKGIKMLSYRIIKFNQSTGSIVVQYKKDDVVIATYNFDIPIDDGGLYLVGDELHERLMSMMPTQWIARMESLANGVANAADIEALVDPLPVIEPTPLPAGNQPISTGTQAA